MSAMPTLIESLVTPCVVSVVARRVAPNVSAASSNVTTQTASVERRMVRVVSMRSPPVPQLARAYDQRARLSRQGGVRCPGRPHGTEDHDHRWRELPVDPEVARRLREHARARG